MSDKKNILIVYPVNFKGDLNRGIYDKMIGQGEAFIALNYNVICAFLEGSNGVILYENKKDIFAQALSTYWSKYHSFFSGLENYCKTHHFEIFYIRHLIHSHSLLSFLKQIQSKSSQVVYEFPTLPYEKEWRKPLHRLILLEDSFIKSKIDQYIDKVVHYGGYKGSLNSVQIRNGIIAKSNLNPPVYTGGVFSMIAVGRWEYWHGLDRLIKGISESNPNIELNIVGDGPALYNYKSLVKRLNLGEKVAFHPPFYGNELERLVLKSHVGIGTLGLHRKGVALDSSLKHRMYCSYGLPFLYAGRDDDFSDDLSFVLKVEATDAVIDLDRVICDYHLREIYPAEIKDFAQDYLSWERRMSKVLE